MIEDRYTFPSSYLLSTYMDGNPTMLNNQEISAPLLIEDLGIMPISLGSKHKKRFGIFKCHCGAEFKTTFSSIKSGNAKSCGCLNINKIKQRMTTHGLSKHRLFSVWKDMMQRCNNKNSDAFVNYGGRGITVCERWENVENFIKDMYPTFKEGLTLDRRDNDGSYEPSNCRWVTQTIQARNKRVISSNNTSGYRGVCFDKFRSKWVSTISINNKTKRIGYFATVIEAAKAYDNFVVENNLEHTINGIV